MVKKYGELYLNARKALRPSQGDNASVYARELMYIYDKLALPHGGRRLLGRHVRRLGRQT